MSEGYAAAMPTNAYDWISGLASQLFGVEESRACISAREPC